jgi:aspartate/methionine/tyrosine aminotransferase
MFPERFSNLPAYAFPRLRALLDPHPAGGPVRHMTIGEPKHPFPSWIKDLLADEVAGFGQYPPNEGTPELRRAITDWLHRRYGVTLDPEAQVMALNGTREGLYNACMALVPEEKQGKQPVILMPNPFYQVYMIGAISVRAEPVFVSATRDTGYLPDYTALSPEVLNRVAAAYICSPANPQGAVASRAYWADLIALAEQYDFQVFADECYSEIYRGDPPTGALEVAAELGTHPDRVSSSCAPMPARRCRCPCNAWPRPSGPTRRMCGKTARFTVKNTWRRTRYSPASTATRAPRRGFSCGCQWMTAKRPR